MVREIPVERLHDQLDLLRMQDNNALSLTTIGDTRAAVQHSILPPATVSSSKVMPGDSHPQTKLRKR